MFEAAVKIGSWITALFAIILILPFCNDFISMVNACEDAAEEVQKIRILFTKSNAYMKIYLISPTGKEIQRICAQIELRFV